MNKKKYITPVIVIEKMELPDLMAVSGSEIVTANEANPPVKNSSPGIMGGALTDQDAVGSKESDWSFDYSFDIDW